MRFMYDFARLPTDTVLLDEINQAAERLATKLDKLNRTELDISNWHRRVLLNKLENATHELQAFGFVLAWALQSKSKHSFENIVFLEAGGGLGFISLLARELGIGTVIFNDIYDIACKDAQCIAQALDLRADAYLEGDIDELIRQLDERKLIVDAIGSFDVIEHVYDIDSYLAQFSRLGGGRATLAMASYANMYNRRYTNEMCEFQVQCEQHGRSADGDNFERDALRPYIDIRREMIKSYAAGRLSEDEIQTLATRTRGQRQDDIEKSVDQYIRVHELPSPPPHPTNTCDPYTGNWQEHLMNPQDLVATLAAAGFDAEWISGYYSCRGSSALKRSIGKCINVVIRALNRKAVSFAPFYMIKAKSARS